MDDAFGVRGVEAVRDLDGQIQKGFRFYWTARDAVFQGYAVQVFHGDEGLVALAANLIHGADVGVI